MVRQMKASKKIGQFAETEPLETLRELGHASVDTIKTQADASVDALWNQLLGVKETSHPTSGDLQAGQEISFTISKKQETPYVPHEIDTTKHYDTKEGPVKKAEIAAAIDYRSEILHGEKRISRETEQMLSRQIEEITLELRKLVTSSQELAVQFKDVAVEQRVTKVGKYHVSLFSFVLSIVRMARQKVESSKACLSIAKGRKKKQGYWDMFEEQGTSFSMNNERAIATQAG